MSYPYYRCLCSVHAYSTVALYGTYGSTMFEGYGMFHNLCKPLRNPRFDGGRIQTKTQLLNVQDINFPIFLYFCLPCPCRIPNPNKDHLVTDPIESESNPDPNLSVRFFLPLRAKNKDLGFLLLKRDLGFLKN
jgi:hypothetical protein